MRGDDWFVCSACKEKCDDPEEYIYPISELAEPYREGLVEDDDLWECRECYQQGIDDKYMLEEEETEGEEDIW